MVNNFPFKVTDADISWTSIYYITDFRMKYDYLPMQSVPITTNVVISNPPQARYTGYNIM